MDSANKTSESYLHQWDFGNSTSFERLKTLSATLVHKVQKKIQSLVIRENKIGYKTFDGSEVTDCSKDKSNLTFGPVSSKIIHPTEQKSVHIIDYQKKFDSRYQVTNLPLELNHVFTIGKIELAEESLMTLTETLYNTESYRITLSKVFDSTNVSKFTTLFDSQITENLLILGVQVDRASFQVQVLTLSYFVQEVSLIDVIGRCQADADYLVRECQLDLLKFQALESENYLDINKRQIQDAEFLSAFESSIDTLVLNDLFTTWISTKKLTDVNSQITRILLAHLIRNDIFSLEIIMKLIENVVFESPKGLIVFICGKGDTNLCAAVLSKMNLCEHDLVILLKFFIGVGTSNSTTKNAEFILELFSKNFIDKEMTSCMKSLTITEIKHLLEIGVAHFNSNVIKVNSFILAQ